MHYKTNESNSTSYRQVIHGGEGEITRTSFFKDILKLPINFEVWELAPRVSEGNHTHEEDSGLEELSYFIKGEGIMWADGEEITVGAGDVFLAPKGSDHGLRNTGNSPLKLMIIWGKPSDLKT